VRPAARALIAALCLAGPGEDGAAQSAKEESVRERPRPELDPNGIELDDLLSAVGLLGRETAVNNSSPLSSFLVFPKLVVEPRYETNIFRTERNAQPDRIVVVSPELRIASDWVNHAASFIVGADLGRFDRRSTEDYDNWRAAFEGTLELTDEARARGVFKYQRLFEERGAIDDRGPDSPLTVYSLTTAGITGEYGPQPILMRAAFEAKRFDFDSTGQIDNDDRDRTELGLKTRLGYELVENTILFVEPSANRRVYERRRDFDGLARDSHGFQGLIGLSWDASGVTFAEFGVGYLSQRYDDPALPRIQAPTFSASAIWNATDLMTVSVKLERLVEETTLVGISGILTNRFTAAIDYEIIDGVIVGVGGGHVSNDYRGGTREDASWNAAITLDYLIHQTLFAGLRLAHAQRSSNTAGFDYSNAIIALRLGAQF